MSDRVAIIDEDSRGWAIENSQDLKNSYSRVLTAGKNSDLPELTSDTLIVSHSKKNKYDLFTADKKSYTNYFDSDVHTIQITKYAYWDEGKSQYF